MSKTIVDTNVPIGEDYQISSQVQLSRVDNTFDRSYDGMSISSWNTKANGTGTTYSLGQIVKKISGKLVLYAQWQQDYGTIEYYECYPQSYLVTDKDEILYDSDGNALVYLES